MTRYPVTEAKHAEYIIHLIDVDTSRISVRFILPLRAALKTIISHLNDIMFDPALHRYIIKSEGSQKRKPGAVSV